MGLIIPNLGYIIPDMGINNLNLGKPESDGTGIAGALFSTVQQRLLALLFGHPETSFYTSEIIRTLQSGNGAVTRELARLEASGLILAGKIGNQKHYRANRRAPIFEELYGIVQKTVGLAGPLRQALAPFMPSIHAAFVYGSMAKGNDTARSDIDLMVISERLTYSDLFTALTEAEKILMRPVNPTLLSPEEWAQKRRDGNSFLERVAAQPKIFIVGAPEDLGAGDEPVSR